MDKVSGPSCEVLRARGRTAMARTLASRPVAVALSDGVIRPGTTVFDYGCGRGSDLRHLQHFGIDARGWDPVYAPGEHRAPADVVNLGYVVNVIENEAERSQVLRTAWRWLGRRSSSPRACNGSGRLSLVAASEMAC